MWCNRREFPRTIRERLDRACSNDRWAALSPVAAVFHILEASLYHAALLLDSDDSSEMGAKRDQQRFHFGDAWLRFDDCKGVIEQVWVQMQEGDRNTSFFHDRETERLHCKEIKWLRTAEGAVVEGTDAIQCVILEYFSNIFSSTRPDGGVIDEIVACLEPKVFEVMDLNMLCSFTKEEIKQALDEMQPLNHQAQMEELAGLLGVVRVLKHEIYLGLSSIIDQSMKEVFEGIKDQVRQQLQGWTSKHLSQAGRAALIQSVIQAIPTYVMSCFLIPDLVLSDIERIALNFFWIKTGWGENSSFTLKSLMASQSLINEGLQWEIGLRISVKVVDNLSLPLPPTFKLVCQPQTLPVDATVSSLLNEGCNRRWELILEEFAPVDAKCILQCKVGDSPDKLIWQCHPKGKFMVRSVYGVLVARGYQS
ncbi:hypothetical protein Sango_1264100 [Sesamum angolense]|uniref:Uncharacterized protein n=1 Tax=Sesamum angolense TaxID=2727404 RepID=A0AAE1WQT5_9LAMI|nr:hypothetical protein Sango_1264100 [Sesamum angolense]